MPKLPPKAILEGTRLTFKAQIAFAIYEHPRVAGCANTNTIHRLSPLNGAVLQTFPGTRPH
jgi:hypothetical protein